MLDAEGSVFGAFAQFEVKFSAAVGVFTWAYANDFVLWAGRSSMRPSVEMFFCATRQSTSSFSNSSSVNKGSSTPSTSETMPG